MSSKPRKEIPIQTGVRFHKMLRRQMKAAPKIAIEEWDFSRCAKEHLKYCEIYEFARESQACRAQVEDWMTNKSWLNCAPGERGITLTELQRSDLIKRFPEFPKKPWLSFTESEINKRIRGLPRRRATPIRDLSDCPDWGTQVPSPEVREIFTKNAALFFLNHTSSSIAPSFADQGSKRHQQRGVKMLPYRDSSIHKFEINWWCSDADLQAEFSEWLKKNRPRKHADKRGRTPIERLKNLAAKRLLDHHSIKEAIEITSATDEDGEPLFKTDAEWSRAKGICDELLKSIEGDAKDNLARFGWQLLRELLHKDHPDLRARAQDAADQMMGKVKKFF